ncbi:MAG: PKD domain-containing protein [Acidobacteria bacterium]|nr:PKD domain-containing protein [Acidobacteriota bacterium]
MRRICALLAGLLVPLAPGCDRPIPVAPEGSTLTVTANPSKIQILGSSSITILARKMDGTPVNGGTEITLSTNLGTIEPLVKTDAGGVAKATLTGDGRIGTAVVQAFSGAAGEATIDVQIGSLAAFIEITAQPSVIPRDGGTTVIRAVAFDNDGAPIVGAFMTFSSEIGLLASGGQSIQTDTSGQASDTLTVTRNDMSSLSDSFFLVTVTTSGEGGAPVEEFIEIDIGGTPAALIFQATPTTILQTGGTVRLQVTVNDGNFDPLPDISVFFGSDIGSLASGGSAVKTNSVGEARDTLTATESDLTAFGGTSFVVEVQAGGVGGVVIVDSATIRIQTGIPRASFIATPVHGSSREYQFTSTSTGTAPLSCEWRFGDGGTETRGCSEVVAHNYDANGTFTVTLVVTNNLGESTATGSVMVPHDQ